MKFISCSMLRALDALEWPLLSMAPNISYLPHTLSIVLLVKWSWSLTSATREWCGMHVCHIHQLEVVELLLSRLHFHTSNRHDEVLKINSNYKWVDALKLIKYSDIYLIDWILTSYKPIAPRQLEIIRFHKNFSIFTIFWIVQKISDENYATTFLDYYDIHWRILTSNLRSSSCNVRHALQWFLTRRIFKVKHENRFVDLMKWIFSLRKLWPRVYFAYFAYSAKNSIPSIQISKKSLTYVFKPFIFNWGFFM